MEGFVLIAGSLAWIIVWLLLGFVAASGIVKWRVDMGEVAKEGNLEKFWDLFDGFKKQTVAHAHVTAMSTLTIVIGILMKAGHICFSDTLMLILAIVLLAGIFLAGIGERLRIVPLSALGSLLFLAGTVTAFVGLLM
jgi:hypothetical protein